MSVRNMKRNSRADSVNCALNGGEVDGEILPSRKWIVREPALIPWLRARGQG